MPSPDTVQHREGPARHDFHYSAQRSCRMGSTEENPSAARIASCRCSWLGPPAILSGGAITGSKTPQQTNCKNPLSRHDVWMIPAQRTGQQWSDISIGWSFLAFNG